MKTQVLNFVRARLNTLLRAEDEEEETGGVAITARTTITKEWVEQTIREADVGPTAVADAAARFGKASHTIIEKSIKRGAVKDEEEEEEVDPRYEVMVQNYHSWLAQSGLEIKEAEKFVWSETYVLCMLCAHAPHTHSPVVCVHRHRYAGSLDAWGVCTGQDGRQRLVVVDWKVWLFMFLLHSSSTCSCCADRTSSSSSSSSSVACANNRRPTTCSRSTQCRWQPTPRRSGR
jgi:hypothetical protein